MSTTLTLNGKATTVASTPDTPLLWVLRGELGLLGTKYGCGMAQCGACTVHLDGVPIRACVTPLSSAAGHAVTTIEGLAGPVPEAVLRAWDETEVVQCGYCQSGQIMSACALLKDKPRPSEAEVDAAMRGNICRCGTYPRIRVAIGKASESLG